MPPRRKSRFWRRARLTFRWARITGWLALLALICGLLYLNRHGLPAFLHQRLLAELRAQGLDFASTRIRLRWYRGIVAENVRLQQASPGTNPSLSARELVLRPDWGALLSRTFRLRGMVLSDGRLCLPLLSSNTPPREAVIEGLHAQVDFLEDDRWQLSALDGSWLGFNFHFSGVLSNAPALLKWTSGESAFGQQRAEFWSQVVAHLEQVRFLPAASVRGHFAGDAQNPEASSARLDLVAASVGSPWGSARDAAVSLGVRPGSNGVARVEWGLQVKGAQLQWARIGALSLEGQANVPFAAPDLQNVRLNLSGHSLRSEWGRAGSLNLEAEAASLTPPRWTEKSHMTLKLDSVATRWGSAPVVVWKADLRPDPANPALAQGVYEIRCTNLQGGWVKADHGFCELAVTHTTATLQPLSARAKTELEQAVFLTGESASSTPVGPGQPVPADARVLGRARSVRLGALFSLPAEAGAADGATNFWRLVTPNRSWIDANIGLVSPAARGAELDRLDLVARWRPPVLLVEPLVAMLGGGQINATARVDVVTRELSAGFASDVPLLRLAPFVTTNSESWTTLTTWEQPPKVQAALKLLLPAWTNLAPDRFQQALATLSLAAAFQAGPGAIRSIPVTSVRGALLLTNQLWQAQEVELVRPEGRLRASLDYHSGAGGIHATVQSGVDPGALRPLLGTNGAGQALDYFRFTQPPLLEGEVWGRWGEWDRLGFRGRMALTNITFRDQAIKSCVAGLAFTNQMLDFFGARLERPEGAATVDQVRVDFRKETVNLTNLNSRIEVYPLAAAIGPHVVKTLSPYRFGQPPAVHFQGVVGIRNKSGLDDAHFEVSGGPFQWQNFKFDQVAARLHWLGDSLTLTNFEGAIRQGTATGDAFFDFTRDVGMDFRFRLSATNVAASPLLADLFPANTNRLEGRLGGHLSITNASTAPDGGWFGYGDVTLREGMIWNVPVFRYVSPVLNSVVPGLGNSQARSGAATFLITNNVIATRDLEVHASAMRMQMDGTVDFQGRVHGKIEAELFRDTPGFGWFLSRVFWPVTKVLSYKIGGVLGRPTFEPLYIPKVLTAPFHPLRTLKELFSEPKAEEKPEPSGK